MVANTGRRRPWIAALLALLCNGLGHAYAGRLGTALVVHGLWLALGMGFLAAVQTGPRATLGAGVVLLAYWIAQA